MTIHLVIISDDDGYDEHEYFAFRDERAAEQFRAQFDPQKVEIETRILEVT